MDEPIPLMPRPRAVRAKPGPGAVALQRQLDATRAALAEETHRRELAQANLGRESRRHETTRAALGETARRLREAEERLADEQAHRARAEASAAEVARAARTVLHAQQPAVAPPETLPARLADVLGVLTAPMPAVADGAERADELGRRYERVRAQLAAPVPPTD